MIIADRVRQLRTERELSQGDIERRTGLLRCYISRVEGGYTVPSFETMEKFARALEVPMYQLFYDGEEPPKVPILRKSSGRVNPQVVDALVGAAQHAKFCRLLNQMDERSRNLLYSFARKMAKSKPDHSQ
jgi:transcriptional regulator with XRE-family HTH domain